ncbi:uncharacterized protein [Phyllobates terribilis]|uniref:uncharacterized protein n=1 Tax=Phyllobates terribilis TaxID=111132 RepID=UPI003CCA9F92
MDTVHRISSVDWKPTPVVALTTSSDGSRVAAARQDGTVEIWLVTPGSVGWHCQLTIHGDQNSESRVSSLVWCRSEKRGDPSGRLYSSSIDGSISEWDLRNLRQKIALDSIGTSIWQMAVQPCDKQTTYDDESESQSNSNGTVIDNNSNEYDSGSSSSDDDDDYSPAELHGSSVENPCVALACDDGCVRLYSVSEAHKFIYKKSLPRVSGRALSVTWSHDGNMIFSGSSDGFVRCWDAERYNERYRITVGLGGRGSGPELCVWSLLALRSGMLVSGDSSGSVQFWDSEQGTLLQAHSHHKGDVNALAVDPSHNRVFSAGSDGKVILYKFSKSANSSSPFARSPAEVVHKWVYVGDVRSHTHDVRALAVVTPITEGAPLPDKKEKKFRRKEKPHDYSYHKWARFGVPMIISAGDDTKLFAYSAKDFLTFSPHDICPAPQRVPLQLVFDPVIHSNPLLLVQGASSIDILSICVKNGYSAGKVSTPTETKLVSRVNCSGRIISSAMSSSGSLVSYSSNVRISLFELKKSKNSSWSINKKKLPSKLPSAWSMAFTPDSSRLIVAGRDSLIHVVDAGTSKLSYVLTPRRKDDNNEALSPVEPPIVKMLISSNGQWLAAVNCYGDIYIFNLEIQRQHWFIPTLDGASVTAAGFHPRYNNILIITTSLNHVHDFDVEAKQWGKLSKRNTSSLPESFQNYPGEVIGLSFPPSATSLSVIVYSPRAMCLIDFEHPLELDTSFSGKKRKLHNQNSELFSFSNPVLFVGHLSATSMVVVEKPWKEVVRGLEAAPVHRHIYGT